VRELGNRLVRDEESTIERIHHEAMQVIVVEQAAFRLQDRFDQIFERLAAKVEMLVGGDDESPAADLLGEVERDRRPVGALAQQFRFQLRRLDPVFCPEPGDQRVAFGRREIDRGIGEDRLVVVEQCWAGEAGFIAGNQGRGRVCLWFGHFERIPWPMRP